MFQLSEHQIDIIYERLQQDKLKSVKLEQDLFDHFCCYVEEQMLLGESFEASYNKAINAISPNGTKEIEFELYFIMNFNKQLTMKKLIFLSSFISTFLLSTGLMFKTLDWFAARILLFSGFTVLFLTMIFLVIYATRFLRNQPVSFWLRSVAGTTSIALIAIGFMFRTLHIPGANILYGLGTILLNFIFLPLFFFQLYKYGFTKTSSNQTVSKAVILVLFSVIPFTACAQQEVDRGFVPHINHPLFEQGKGPLIVVDEGHHNFHTLEDKFSPFGKIAAMNGFRIQGISAEINSEHLKHVKILVIANALNEKNVDSWQQPVCQAFNQKEIKQISDWVWNGGRLFLIADHMPFSGAVAELAQSMGYSFFNGFALRKPKKKFDIFSFADRTLLHSRITDLHGPLDSIVTFTGQAFKIPDSATSIITLDSNYTILLPEIAWQFDGQTKAVPAEGFSQLAYSTYGSGKIVVAGEALMFTAQRAGDFKIGLNAPFARNNMQLLLNIFEWLND